MPVRDVEGLLDNRIEAIRRLHRETGLTRAEVDVSGGIDSAVLAGLTVLALGAENVTLAHLAINSNGTQTARAVRLCRSIGCRLAVADFTNEYTSILNKVRSSLCEAGYDAAEIEARLRSDPTIEGSIRSTLRAPLGRAYNRITGGGIRHGTGNECEDRFLRFFQKGGDGEVDTNPIAMLSKTETYQLALAIGRRFGTAEAIAAFAETVAATPSPDLWGVGDTHNDETELAAWTGAPFTYGRVDPVSGAVTRIGTIEMVARFLDGGVAGDLILSLPQSEVETLFLSCADNLFGRNEAILFRDNSTPDLLAKLIESAKTHPAFNVPGAEVAPDVVGKLLLAARKAERTTRHKLNPNCPQLGSRDALVKAYILTNDLSAYNLPVSAKAR